MNPLIPLLFTLIALNGRQVKGDTLYRLKVLFLIGIACFLFLFHINYWHEMFSPAAWITNTLAILIVLMTVAVGLSSWIRGAGIRTTSGLGIVFFLVLMGSYAFDRDIKEIIAHGAGFYKGETLTEVLTTGSKNGVNVTLPVGLEMRIPGTWEQRKLPPGHTYFTRVEDGRQVLEVRPNCLGKSRLDTPTIIRNTFATFEADRKGLEKQAVCRASAFGEKQCLIQVRYGIAEELPYERWYWLSIPHGRGSSSVVDVLLFNDSVDVRSEVLSAIASIQKVGEPTGLLCRTPAAWL